MLPLVHQKTGAVSWEHRDSASVSGVDLEPGEIQPLRDSQFNQSVGDLLRSGLV